MLITINLLYSPQHFRSIYPLIDWDIDVSMHYLYRVYLLEKNLFFKEKETRTEFRVKEIKRRRKLVNHCGETLKRDKPIYGNLEEP